jgi:hypothetical protein
MGIKDRREALWNAFWQAADNHVDAKKELERWLTTISRASQKCDVLIDWVFGHLCNQGLSTLIQIAETGRSDYRQCALAAPFDVQSLTFKPGSFSSAEEQVRIRQAE